MIFIIKSILWAIWNGSPIDEAAGAEMDSKE